MPTFRILCSITHTLTAEVVVKSESETEARDTMAELLDTVFVEIEISDQSSTFPKGLVWNVHSTSDLLSVETIRNGA